MSNSTLASSDGWTPRRAVAGLLLLVGLGLVGWGGYLHLTIAGRVRAGACDGCAPWHPLFVVTPLVVGTASLLAAGALLRRG